MIGYDIKLIAVRLYKGIFCVILYEIIMEKAMKEKSRWF